MTVLGVYGKDVLSITQWFNLSRYFLRLVTRISRTRTLASMKFLAALGISTDVLSPTSTGHRFELLPVNEREALLDNVSLLVEVGPEFFFNFAQLFGFSQNMLCQKGDDLPDSLTDGVLQLPFHQLSRRRKIKNPSCQPCSKVSILTKWERLKRRLRVK